MPSLTVGVTLSTKKEDSCADISCDGPLRQAAHVSNMVTDIGLPWNFFSPTFESQEIPLSIITLFSSF